MAVRPNGSQFPRRTKCVILFVSETRAVALWTGLANACSARGSHFLSPIHFLVSEVQFLDAVKQVLDEDRHTLGSQCEIRNRFAARLGTRSSGDRNPTREVFVDCLGNLESFCMHQSEQRESHYFPGSELFYERRAAGRAPPRGSGCLESTIFRIRSTLARTISCPPLTPSIAGVGFSGQA